MKCITGLFALLMINHVIAGWQNSYDQEFTFTCPTGQVIYKVKSQHSNSKEDRQFEFFCRSFSASLPSSSCTWTGYINEYDQPFTATCPYNGVVVGVNSKHSNSKEDRIWKLKCCQSSAYNAINCYDTPLINDWDDYHTYTTPTGYFIHGVAGMHDNSMEDRRWKYHVCQAQAA
ncbi:dermatopontin-like [Antedon mediterranea]|uniref:dermatopontin-like n=1 Tax=Antedon mediterranea TaxID=105859 RepID=UPI003AF4E53C